MLDEAESQNGNSYKTGVAVLFSQSGGRLDELIQSPGAQLTKRSYYFNNLITGLD